MSDTLSRRAWLRGAAGSSAAAAVGSRLLILNAADAAPAQRVTIGVMGLSRGLSLAKTFGRQPGLLIKYLADVDSDRLASARAEVEKSTGQTPQITGDFRHILDDPEVDALVCAAPNHWHAPATILACSAGKHVYVEKPCCHNPAEGELMVAAARKHHRAVQMGSQRRSCPGVQQAMELLHGGAVGKVYLARCWYYADRGSIGHGHETSPPPQLDYELWQGPAPRAPYVDNRIPYNWHWFWHWGNGELGNNGVHTIDLARWGLGVDYPLRATSSGGRYAFSDDQQTPDTQTAAFEFEGGCALTWEGLSCNNHGRDQFVAFYGERGSLELSSGGGLKLFDQDDKLLEERSSRLDDSDHAANFLEAIRNDQPQLLNAEILQGHRSTLLCHLGNIAHRVGRVLNCRAEDGAIQGDAEAAAHWSRAYESGWEPQV